MTKSVSNAPVSQIQGGTEAEQFKKVLDLGGPMLKEFPSIILALCKVKKAAALSNRDLGLISENLCEAICRAADECACGLPDEAGQLGLIGAWGRPVNAVINEAIADRASSLGSLEVTPADVNLSQGSWDVMRTAEQLVSADSLSCLTRYADTLAASLEEKAEEFKGIVKSGRLSLRDGYPITLGQEFHGYAAGICRVCLRLKEQAARLNTSLLGAGDFGNGIGVAEGFRSSAADHLSAIEEREISVDPEPFDGLSATDQMLLTHAHIQSLAVVFWHICCNLTLTNSGPRGGIHEIAFPAVAPGSSIMPGKINPTMAQLGKQVCDQVSASQLSINSAVQTGLLGVGSTSAIPVMCIAENGELLGRTMKIFAERIVEGLRAFGEHVFDQALSSCAVQQARDPAVIADINEILRGAANSDPAQLDK